MTDTMFASKSLREHWVRGALGLVLAVAGFGLIGVVGPASLLLVLAAGFAWRGCVSCWALGLSQTKASVSGPAVDPVVAPGQVEQLVGTPVDR